MSRVRDIANILSASTAIATDAEVAGLYAPLSNPTFTAIGGDEGGQINFATPATNSTLSGPVNFDVWRNKVRLFEGGGNNRGASIDLSTLSNGVGSELVASTPQSEHTGKSLVTNGTTAVWQENIAAGKNALINGGFDFWQRGTSFTTSGSYCSDRWVYTTEGSSAGTVSQQTTSLPAGFRYSIRCQRNSGNTGTGAIGIAQALESSISIPMQGKTVVLSYWAKAGANYSNSGSVLNVRINSGTGIDQAGGLTQFGGWSGYAETAPNQVITTTWTRYQATYNVPSNATQLGIRFMMYGVGTAGANDWFEITGVQLEIGNVATNFSRAGGTLQGELASCQRYYYRAGGEFSYPRLNSTTNYPFFGTAIATSSTNAIGVVPLPVPMRVYPTSIDLLSAGSYRLLTGNANYTLSGISLDTTYVFASSTTVSIGMSTSGLTTNNFYYVVGNFVPTAYIGFSAEL